tara:strand:+ start:48536 stop:48970 length:435 start_codon:yes stop_codon:yes gene_type:complete
MNIFPDKRLSGATLAITRGVCRHLVDRGYEPLTEFKLRGGRRVDVAALNDRGRFIVIEVKSSVPDFRADSKWPEYLPHCDAFYFAVNENFPLDLLPDDCGILVADAFDAALIREAPDAGMNATRRKHQTLQFARAAAARLRRTG